MEEDEINVCLWHNHGNHVDWSELPLKQTKQLDHVVCLPLYHWRCIISNNSQTLVNGSKQTAKRWFSAELPGRSHGKIPTSFTVKFRFGTGSGWKWVRDQTSVTDGQLLYLQPEVQNELDHYFSGLDSAWTVARESSDAPNSSLFSLTASVRPAAGDDSGISTHSLGLPTNCSRWFALVRLWSPWLAPRQGSQKFSPDKDAVLAAFLRNDGSHVVCLAVSGIDDVLSVFAHDEKGNVQVRARNDREQAGTSHIVVAVADSFEVANAAVMYHAKKLVTARTTTKDEIKKEELQLMDKNMKAEWLEEWYDGLTYCTWNALGQDLTEDKINNALKVLKDENINITNLIIDDNWQSLSEGRTQFDRAWTDFEANKEGFPNGLKAAVSKIRSDHPNINHIAVWHAILGYWGGVSPDGKIAKYYKTIQVDKEKGVAEGKFTVVDAPDAQRMYNDFYEFLSDCGITAVKTDAQFFLDLLSQAPARRSLITEYQDAWTIAHLRHFSSRAISCMSQNPQMLFHSQLPTNKPMLLVRNSDDFFPEVPASHPWHIFCNAHNSLLTQHLNVLPDWDMFQTSHEWAGFHGAARAVSGGPIYFTDYPGQHDIKLLNQMTAQTPRGKTAILRPHRVGKSMNAYVGYEEQGLLKIGTYVGFARTGTGILGIFNCCSQPLSELVRLEDFPGTEEGTYVVRNFEDGMVSKPMQRGEMSAFVGINLDVRGWAIVAAHPARVFEVGQGVGDKVKMSVAMLGLVDKMTGSAAVMNYDVYVEDNGRLRIWTSLKALGKLGVYVSGVGRRSVEDHVMVLLFGKSIVRDAVKVAEGSEDVLEIDVEKAWRESGEEAGWNNEVSLEVFVS